MPKENLILTVVIPCYNEERNLKKHALKDIYDFLQTKNFSYEVIISDDGSTDKSRDIVSDQISNLKNFKLLRNDHGGKPSALLHGINASRGEFILFSDMDQSTPIAEIDKLLPFIEEKVGAIIGSRGLLRKNFPLYRRLGSIIFMAFRKLFILPELDDTQCGFKLFKAHVVKKAFPRLQFFKDKKAKVGWSVTSYDVELLHIIKKMGYEIQEVPVVWEDADSSTSKGSILGRYIKESKEMLVQILRVKLNDMRGMYDL